MSTLSQAEAKANTFFQTATGQLVQHLIVVVVVAVASAVVRDGSLASLAISLGVPASVVNFVVNYLRSDIANI